MSRLEEVLKVTWWEREERGRRKRREGNRELGKKRRSENANQCQKTSLPTTLSVLPRFHSRTIGILHSVRSVPIWTRIVRDGGRYLRYQSRAKKARSNSSVSSLRTGRCYILLEQQDLSSSPSPCRYSYTRSTTGPSSLSQSFLSFFVSTSSSSSPNTLFMKTQEEKLTAFIGTTFKYPILNPTKNPLQP